ncbi:MAG: hypothetical protein J6Q34_09120, partial [Bacteroidales bacterium]|nr:hypothetical protein [Bacteroidales bacterium]
ACLFNIFNELFPFHPSGLTALPFWDRKDTDFFVISKFFRNFFLKKFFISKFRRTCPLRLSHLRAAKVDIISYSANFPAHFFEDFLPQKHQSA